MGSAKRLVLPGLCLAVAALSGCSDPASPGPDAGPLPADAASAGDGGAAPDAGGPADAGAPDASPAAPDSGVACWACHGTQDSPAPPPDLSGSTDRSSPGVGAHAAHLAASTWRNPVKCMHCHVVPAADDAAHGTTGGSAQVTFQGLASAGVTASYQADGTCGVYCHGAKLALSTPRISPAWTSTSGTTCQTCHGLPPASPHPDATDCGRCHLDVVDAAGTITSPDRHIDGYVMAPKGAHLVHLGGAGSTASLDCTECHDGDRYHGLLKDQQPLETTTVCDGCHSGDSEEKKAVWDTWAP